MWFSATLIATLVNAQSQSDSTKPWLHQHKVAASQSEAKAVTSFAGARFESQSTKSWLHRKPERVTGGQTFFVLASTSTKPWLNQNHQPVFEIAPLK